MKEYLLLINQDKKDVDLFQNFFVDGFLKVFNLARINNLRMIII
jgi:hypothetical protein